MAIVSMFYGIIVSMYFFDNRKHHLPHIHIKYQEQEAVISIPEGGILEGNIKPNQDYTITLTFDNNEVKFFDMKPYLNKGIFKELNTILHQFILEKFY